MSTVAEPAPADTPPAAGPSRKLVRAHRRARRKGVSRPLYGFARVVLTPPIRVPLRVRVAGRENVPPEGPVILAPNHKSFVDVFLVGLAMRRPVRFMAKSELFKGPLPPLMTRLGAFPVERGKADASAFETACVILEQGGIVTVFPEGTRVDQADALGTPHHGAGRLALATGAPIVPVAVAGTADLLIGPFPRPRRVWVTFLEPVDPQLLMDAPDPVVELIDNEVWPAVMREYGRLRSAPGLIAAGLAALGVGGGLLVRHAARSEGEPRLLGVVEPRRLRRKQSRRRWLRERLRRG